MKIKIEPQPVEQNPRKYKRPGGEKLCEGMIDGWLRTWLEYVPTCYDGSKPVPLVLSLHGAAHHTANVYTAWQLIAERECFIVVYPHCLIEEIKFNVWQAYSAEDGMPDDVEYIDKLIDLIIGKYNIDKERIYIQGQSVGDGMTTTYLFEHGDRIAAAAPLSGPGSSSIYVDPETGEIIRKPNYPVPVIRTHGSEDTDQPLGDLGRVCILGPKGAVAHNVTGEEALERKWIIGQRLSIDAWVKGDGCSELPKLGICGRYNWAKYEGDQCDVIYYIVEGGVHGPYLDMADFIWTYFFTEYRRVHGKIVRQKPDASIEPDIGAIVLAKGASRAYINNTLVDVDDEGRMVRYEGGAFLVPVKFIEKAIPGAKVSLADEGQSAVITYKDQELQVAMGNRAGVWNNHLHDMARTLWFDDSLYVPIADIAHALLGYHSVERYDVLYCAGRDGKLTFDMAYIIRQLLGTQKVLSPAETLAYEKEVASSSAQFSPHSITGGHTSKETEEAFVRLKKKYEQNLQEFLEKQKSVK